MHDSSRKLTTWGVRIISRQAGRAGLEGKAAMRPVLRSVAMRA